MLFIRSDGRRARVGKGVRATAEPRRQGVGQREKEPLRKAFQVSPVGTSDKSLGRRARCTAHSRARIRRRTTKNPAIPTTAIGRPI